MNNKYIYQQLAANIKEKINMGEYRLGEFIMSERKMSDVYKINRLTVRKAIQILADEGYIEKIQGKGNIVIKQPNNNRMVFGEDNAISLSRSLIQKGFKNTRKVISLKETKEPKNILELFEGSKTMYELIRLSEIDEKPYAYQICYIPSKYYESPERFDFEQYSLYTYMDIYNKVPIKYEEEMEIIKANEKFKDVFKLDKNNFLFKVIYKNYSKENELLEYTIGLYLSENTLFKHFAKK